MDNITRLLDMGAQHDKRKEYAQAAAAYNAALKQDPDNHSILFCAGWSQFKAGNSKEGL